MKISKLRKLMHGLYERGCVIDGPCDYKYKLSDNFYLLIDPLDGEVDIWCEGINDFITLSEKITSIKKFDKLVKRLKPCSNTVNTLMGIQFKEGVPYFPLDFLMNRYFGENG